VFRERFDELLFESFLEASEFLGVAYFRWRVLGLDHICRRTAGMISEHKESRVFCHAAAHVDIQDRFPDRRRDRVLEVEPLGIFGAGWVKSTDTPRECPVPMGPMMPGSHVGLICGFRHAYVDFTGIHNFADVADVGRNSAFGERTVLCRPLGWIALSAQPSTLRRPR